MNSHQSPSAMLRCTLKRNYNEVISFEAARQEMMVVMFKVEV